MLYLCVLCSASLNFAGFTLSPPGGKDTKSWGIKTLLGEKTSKNLQISEIVLNFAFINKKENEQ
jgi:hypothetical protein